MMGRAQCGKGGGGRSESGRWREKPLLERGEEEEDELEERGVSGKKKLRERTIRDFDEDVR